MPLRTIEIEKYKRNFLQKLHLSTLTIIRYAVLAKILKQKKCTCSLIFVKKLKQNSNKCISNSFSHFTCFQKKIDGGLRVYYLEKEIQHINFKVYY